MPETRIKISKKGAKYAVTDVMKVENIPAEYQDKFLMFDNETKTLIISKPVKLDPEEKAKRTAERKEKLAKVKAEKQAENAKKVAERKVMRKQISDAKKLARKTLEQADIERVKSLEEQYLKMQ